MLGPILFLVFFLMIAPASRTMILGWLSDAGKWTFAWAPFSYILILLLIVAPFVSYYLMLRWPKPPEPDNPLARFKRGEDIDVEPEA